MRNRYVSRSANTFRFEDSESILRGELGEAARLIDSREYEVIIQDLRLGATRKLDGLYIVRLAHKMYPETRIIVLTAYGSAEIEAEAKRCGAAAFLRKPRPLSQVAQVVQVLMESPVQLAVRPAARRQIQITPQQSVTYPSCRLSAIPDLLTGLAARRRLEVRPSISTLVARKSDRPNRS